MAARPSSSKPMASASSRTVSTRGPVRAPRSRSLTPRALSPAFSASSSCDSAAAVRWRRSSSPYSDVPSVAMPGPGWGRALCPRRPSRARRACPNLRNRAARATSAMVRMPPPCRLRGRCVGAASGRPVRWDPRWNQGADGRRSTKEDGMKSALVMTGALLLALLGLFGAPGTTLADPKDRCVAAGGRPGSRRAPSPAPRAGPGRWRGSKGRTAPRSPRGTTTRPG